MALAERMQMLNPKRIMYNRLLLVQGEHCVHFKIEHKSNKKRTSRRNVSKSNRNLFLCGIFTLKRWLLRGLTLHQSACWTHLGRASIYYIRVILCTCWFRMEACNYAADIWLRIWIWASPAMCVSMWKTVRISVRIKETFQLYCTVISLQQTSIVADLIQFYTSHTDLLLLSKTVLDSTPNFNADLIYAIMLRLYETFDGYFLLLGLLCCIKAESDREQHNNKRHSVQISIAVLSIFKEWNADSVWD